MQSIPSDLKQRVLEARRRTPSMTRPQSRARTLAGAALAALALIGALYIAGGPGHAEGRPLAMTVAISLGSAAIAALATWGAASRTRWMLGRGRATLWIIALGTPVLLAAWLICWHAAYVDPFERLGARCFLLTLATAPWPFAAMVASRKTIDPRHPGLLGAALGAAAGAWAGVMVDLWCPLAEPGHVARGHVLPFVVLVPVAALLGRRLFSLKSQ
jgi:hypothetical protein